MSGNLLNLVVKFTSLDGLSGSLKSMIGLGRTSKQAIGDLYKQAAKLKSEMGGVEAEMKKSASASMHMMDKYKALESSIANVNRQIERQKRLMAIDGRTARIQRQADTYKSEGRAGLMSAAMLMAPGMAIAHEAGEYQALQNKLRILGLNNGAVDELTAYSKAMGIAGSSAKENLRYLLEAQGAFRESGKHTVEEQLEGAKLMGPQMAKMAATLKATGKELTEDQERYFLRFVEQAGGTTDPKRAKELTDGLFRALQSSGGTVDAAAYQGFLAKAGTAGMRLSTRTMFADFEPLIAEMHESAGVGLRTAYQRMNGMVKSQPAARELLRLGLWNKDAVVFNQVGGIKEFKNGQNPLRKEVAAMLSTDPVEFYRKYILPAYQKHGVTDIERENALLFGGTGGNLFNLMNKQQGTILHSRDAFAKTQGLDDAYETTKDSFFGQQGQMVAAAKDFMVAAGAKGGLLESMTSLLKSASGALRGLTDAANAHPTAFKWLGTAVMWLIGLRVATAGAKLAFGGLLGPFAQVWGFLEKRAVFDRLLGSRAMGGMVNMLVKMPGLLGRTAMGMLALSDRLSGFVADKGAIAVQFLADKLFKLGGIAFRVGGTALRALGGGFIWMGRAALRAGLFMMANPMVALIMAIVVATGLLGYAVYKNWDKIKGWIKVGSEWIRQKLGGLPDWMKSLGKMMMDGLMMALNPSLLVTRLTDIARQGATAFKNYFGIKSPSRLMMEMGGHIATGLGIGMDSHAHRPKQAMRRMAVAVAGAGALTMAPMASAGTAASAGARAPEKIEIHIHQLPGEDADALAQRVMEKIERAQRGTGLATYADDF